MQRQRLSSTKRLYCQILLKVKPVRTEDWSEPGASGTEASGSVIFAVLKSIPEVTDSCVAV